MTFIRHFTRFGILVLLCGLVVSAQQPQQRPTTPAPQLQTPATPQEPFVFKINTQLVIETVSVVDRNGKPIEDLKEKDFLLTEDNVPQEIKVFEFQKLDNTPVDPGSYVPTVKPTVKTQIASARPGDVKYEDRRLMVLYFDMSAMPEADQYRALAAAEQFLDKNMAGPDLMAVMAYAGGAVRVLQDFTDDRLELKKVLEAMILGEDATTSADGLPTDLGSAFGQDDGEFNIFNTDRQLSALQTASKMLGHLNEQKSLIYFASGLRLNGVDNQAQMRATVNAAIRANVQFWPIDARGLVARAPLGDATMSSPGGIGMYNGNAMRGMADRFARSQDTLYAMAADIGGKAMLDNNDLAAGIVKAQEAASSYYILGYYSTNANKDGKFRRVKISLKEYPNAKLGAYREGYYAEKEFGKFSSAEKERQLEDALMLGDPITELTIAMELNFFQLNSAEYFVPLTVKIPGSELVLAKRGGAEHTLIDFIGEVKDNFGTTIQNMRDKVDIKLSDSTAQQLAKSPVLFDTGFTLLPGQYVIKFLARDAETGRIGTYMTSFVIPNLNKELQKLPISSVVLSSQRIAMTDALYNSKRNTNAVEAANPLIIGGQKLIPSVTRVFSKSRDMFIYLQAYEREATATQPLVAYVTFYRGQLKAFETPPMVVTDGIDAKSKAVPMRFNLSLDQLQTGQYTCQITVLDTTGQKIAYWQAPIAIVP